MQTYAGKAFEIDLDEDWRFFPEPDQDGQLYFQNLRVDAGLACGSMVFARHDRDMDEVAPGFLKTYVSALGEAAAAEGLTEPPKLLSLDQLRVEAGHEWIVSGQTSSRGLWMAWVVVRPFMYFTMRMESLILPAPQLTGLFEQTRSGVFLAELVPGAWD